jgi:hypothetical protein
MTTKKKERELSGGGRRPKDYRLAHNHIMHADSTPHGAHGFRRFWIPPEWIGDGWEQCPCGWQGDRGQHKGKVHYALKEHADGWRKRIKKLGSLEAAYQDVYRRQRAS